MTCLSKAPRQHRREQRVLQPQRRLEAMEISLAHVRERGGSKDAASAVDRQGRLLLIEEEWLARLKLYDNTGKSNGSSSRKGDSAPRNRPGRVSNPVGLVCSECGNPTLTSYVSSFRRSALRTANPSITFQCRSRGSPTASPLSVGASTRQKS